MSTVDAAPAAGDEFLFIAMLTLSMSSALYAPGAEIDLASGSCWFIDVTLETRFPDRVISGTRAFFV